MPAPDAALFTENRARLAALLPAHSLAVVNANDLLPTNADGLLRMHANADLFYLTGLEQEETRLLIFPGAADPEHREILFLRQPDETMEIWEGHKVTVEEALAASGIQTVKWLSEFPVLFRQLMLEAREVFLNQNEHGRATIRVESRDDRFIRQTQRQFPLHQYRRLAPLLHQLRLVKSTAELELIRHAIAVTADGFQRALQFLRPGVNEAELEAEFAHEFTRRHCRFAYNPIVASGLNNCILHYERNDRPCLEGDLVLIDVGASWRNFNADLTRTIPVSGRFTPRQRQVYEAVLRVLRKATTLMRPGKLMADLRQESTALIGGELVHLGLLGAAELKDDPGCVKRYFMHGIGHPLGLDVHDVGDLRSPLAPGWILTCEPGIYLREEGFGIRLENDILVTKNDPVDLMAHVPIDPDEIEALMNP